MTITHERFNQGMSYETYKSQMTRNRDRFEENERTLQLHPDDIQFFAGLPQRLHILALAEDWCGDVVANLPIVGRLVEANETLDLRVFLRDQHPDLMDQYLNNGQHRSIPVFVFFDQDMRELGHWIERPAKISQMQADMISELYATAPELQGLKPGTSPAEMPDEARNRIMQALAAFRSETRELSDREVVRELRELVARGLEA